MKNFAEILVIALLFVVCGCGKTDKAITNQSIVLEDDVYQPAALMQSFG